MAEIWLTNLAGTLRLPLYEIGPYGTWGDLSWITRWGEGSCGMYEASWTMPLPTDFEHPLLRRGSLAEITDGPWRTGSPLVLSQPIRGASIREPWKLKATGIGRDVEGDHSFYAFDGTGAATAVPSSAVDTAITNGWRIAGRHASVPTFAIGATSTTEQLNTVGQLLNATGKQFNVRWGVTQENIVSFLNDPTTPAYQVVPDAAALGTEDGDYASVVWVRYLNSATSTYATVFAVDTPTTGQFGRKEYAFDATPLKGISTATAQAFADGVLAQSKGRLAWANGLTLTSQELLTIGGAPADLKKASEDVGNGCMIRLHGIFSELLEFTGQTWIDIIGGQANYTDGALTIGIDPLGMAAHDMAAIFEAITGLDQAA